MMALPEDLRLEIPRNLMEALRLLEIPSFRPFAGGTDLMVELATGRLRHRDFVSLQGIPELSGIESEPHAITLGAMATYSEILESSVVAAEFPNLREAAALTGARAIQNRGTLGGNIGNASPAADSPPALLSYDAELELRSARGFRWVAACDFFTGYKTTLLAPGELVARVRMRRSAAGLRHYYRKVGSRKALAISKVCVAATARPLPGRGWGSLRIALGSVAPTVVRLREIEELWENAASRDRNLVRACKELAFRSVHPIDDVRSSAEYRSSVAANLVEEFLEGLL